MVDDEKDITPKQSYLDPKGRLFQILNRPKYTTLVNPTPQQVFDEWEIVHYCYKFRDNAHFFDDRVKCPVLDFRNETQIQELVRRMNTNEREQLKKNEKDKFDEKHNDFIKHEPKRNEYYVSKNQQGYIDN